MKDNKHLQKIQSAVTQAMRSQLLNQRPHLFWFTGLSGAGKSTLANALLLRLYEKGRLAYAFDGDNVRYGLCRDLGFSPLDRAENIRRIGEMCRLFLDTGVICLAAFISPTVAVRQSVKDIIGAEYFSEIYVRCPLEVCEARDVKGNYKKARLGIIKNYTGISAPYEEPQNPDLIIETARYSEQECLRRLYDFVKDIIAPAK